MIESTYSKENTRPIPAPIRRWRTLVEGMTRISASKDLDSLTGLIQKSFRDLFNPGACYFFLIDRLSNFFVFDLRGCELGSAQLPVEHPDLHAWLDHYKTPKIIRDISQEKWPDLGQSPDLHVTGSALIIPILIDQQYLAFSLVFHPYPLDEDDLDLGIALTRHAGTVIRHRIESGKTIQDFHQKSAHLEQELALAGEIQRALLPRSIPQLTGLSISLVSEPSGEIGGDFYDMFTIADKYLGVAVGDVVGKGIPGAITMASLYTAFHEYATDPLMIPSLVMHRANEMLLDATASDRFATLFYGVLNLRDGLFRYCNAGHPPPLICRKNGDVEYLSTGGLILGSFPQARYEDGTAHLNEGDILVLYTDGVTETINDQDTDFGFERLEQAVLQCKDLNVEGIKNCLTGSLHQFTNTYNVQDDITVIIVKCDQSFS